MGEPHVDVVRKTGRHVDARAWDIHKRIAMSCTGGIRCEKASGLVHLGSDAMKKPASRLSKSGAITS